MKVKASKHVEAVQDAVALANRFRMAVGSKSILDDLPQAIPSNGKECILARAFNFDCIVSGGGAVYFPKDKEGYAIELANLVGTKPVYSTSHFDDGGWRVSIPSHIARLARYFDGGELNEYVAG